MYIPGLSSLHICLYFPSLIYSKITVCCFWRGAVGGKLYVVDNMTFWPIIPATFCSFFSSIWLKHTGNSLITKYYVLNCSTQKKKKINKCYLHMLTRKFFTNLPFIANINTAEIVQNLFENFTIFNLIYFIILVIV